MKLHVSKSIVVAAVLLFSSTGLIAQDSPAPSAAEPLNAASPVDPSAIHHAHDSTYIIGNDDMLAISVWKETELSRSVPVRSDGKISLPLIGEIQASGKTPLQLESEISDKLKSYITAPEVTVIVEQINSKKFNVMGMVSKPGSYTLGLPLTIMDAIALAGGFRDFAKTKNVYVLRQRPDGTEYRIPFNYKDFIKGKNPAQNVRIEPRDTIIVP